MWRDFLWAAINVQNTFFLFLQQSLCNVGRESRVCGSILDGPLVKVAPRRSHRYLVSGPSDTRHLLHPTSRLVGGALRRAGAGIGLTRASGHGGRMRGGRGGGRRRLRKRWFRLPVCPTIRLHLNLVPKIKDRSTNIFNDMLPSIIYQQCYFCLLYRNYVLLYRFLVSCLKASTTWLNVWLEYTTRFLKHHTLANFLKVSDRQTH